MILIFEGEWKANLTYEETQRIWARVIDKALIRELGYLYNADLVRQ